MVRLGGAASPTYISVFRGLQAHFRRHGIELDWVLYADYDALVEAFVKTRDRSGVECSSEPPKSVTTVSMGRKLKSDSQIREGWIWILRT
jgi:hypothetical protein